MRTNYTFMQSFRFAVTGVKTAIAYNRNLRIHLLATILVIELSILFHLSLSEAGVLAVLVVLVICCEMMNTVIEEVVDLVTREHREEARIAKDVAAGMVLIAASGALAIGLFIFTPHFYMVLRALSTGASVVGSFQ